MTRSSVLVMAMLLSGCSSTTFVSTWQAPDARPLEMRGTRVAAVVMMRNEASRRTAEDTLAREITARGAQGVALYTLVPDALPDDEASVRAILEKAGMSGAVVMRPVRVDKEIVATPVTYSAAPYSGMWGGYYRYGWGDAWGVAGMDIETNTIVSVETLVYSLEQNRLVWGGQSKTTNPSHVDALVREVAEAVAEKLQEAKLISE